MGNVGKKSAQEGVDSILVSLFGLELLVPLPAGLAQCPQRNEEEEGKQGRERGGGKREPCLSFASATTILRCQPLSQENMEHKHHQ